MNLFLRSGEPRVNIVRVSGSKKKYAPERVGLGVFYINKLGDEATDPKPIKIDTTSNPSSEWCIQVIARPGYCQLINFGPKELRFGKGTHYEELRPYAEATADYGQSIALDDFGFVFDRKIMSAAAELELRLPSVLEPHRRRENPLPGRIILRNQIMAEAPEMQFSITSVEGIASTNYRLQTQRTTLNHVEEREIRLTLFHQPGHLIPGGPHYIGVTAQIRGEGIADEDKTIADFQEIYVEPFYEHSLELSCADSSERDGPG